MSQTFISTDIMPLHPVTSSRLSSASQFFVREKHPKAIGRSGLAQVSVECAGHGRSIANDNMSGDNSDHSGERLSQNGDNDFKMSFRNYYIAYAFV